MSDLHKATPDARVDPLAAQLKHLVAEVHTIALRIEMLHGKLDAAIEIRERLAALEARMASK
jgi:hypothetical protein